MANMDSIIIDNSLPLYKKKDFSNIGSLMLMIGMACNMKCRHCGQTPVRNNKFVSNLILSDKVVELLCNYIEYSIHNARLDGKQRHIYFWAGEPLLYWDFIKDVVSKLTSKYKILQNNNFRFGMQSNGLLLTQEKVDFLNEYDVDFGLSYDAPYPFAVRGYVSDEKCALFQKINRRKVQCVCATAQNFNPLLSIKCLRAKFPGATYQVVSNLTRSFDMPEDIYAYDWKSISSNIKALRILAQKGDSFAINWFYGYAKNISGGKTDKDVISLFRCIGNPVELAVSIDGKFNVCHNSNYFLGTVNNSWDELLEMSRNFLKDKSSPDCKECVHTDICEKHCLLDIRDSHGGFVTCRSYLWPLYNIVKRELVNLGQPLTKEDSAWFKEQEDIMDRQVQVFLQEGKQHLKGGENNE